MSAELDQLTPNYLTVNPDGTVGATFTGKVNAEGLVLPASSVQGPTSRIEWDRQSDGAAVAQIAAQSGALANTEGMQIAAIAAAAGNTSQINLSANDNTNATRAQLIISQTNRGAVANVKALVAGRTVTLLDETAQSSFLQLLSAQQLQLQIGTWTEAIGAGGVQGLNITLPTAWPTNHLLFLATCNPNNSFANWSVVAPGVVIGLGTGQCVINNTNAANTSVSGTWLSLGN